MNAAAPVGPIRVLLVEDDDGLRDTMTRCLARAGYQVEPVASGADAVERAGQVPLDAAVIDVLLPDAGGLGVASDLRRSAPGRRLPVLFVTGLSLPSVRDALAPAPVLFKPFTRRQLLASVGRVTAREG